MNHTTRPTVSIIVVSYNTRAMTLDCLASVLRETRETTYELIVVDNASDDRSAEAIAAAFPDARLIRSPENIGFAAANNLASRSARGDYFLLLNPDTVVLEGAIDRLVSFARRRPEALIWGGRTFFADGRLNPSSCWRAMGPWAVFCRTVGLTGVASRSALFNPEAFGGWDRGSEREVDIVSGCFLLISASLWRRLGGFDPTFVMYGEEADLCLRARAFGARPRVTPHARIVHHGGASETAREDKMVRLLKAKAALIRRHWHPALRRPGLALFRLWPGTRLAATRALAALGRPGAAEKAATWGAIWKRRAEWQGGWPDRPNSRAGRGSGAQTL